MSPEAQDLWDRAVRSYKTSARLVEEDPDAAASRVYYAAFYAISAFFALQGKTFTKHRGVESAVHRDLVRAEIWAAELGTAFSWLVRLHATGDYGGGLHVSPAEAREAVDKAWRLLQAVRDISSEPFPNIDELPCPPSI